ncbi:BCCT family transporter [Candidatus Formimonas warabiya]|uniref:Transporter n=1 Tax=Formimonas warabiya TaxID=1761012 RepID=A0A3G1KZT5_FORW1|nr:BCCT family transporter [Candidatus Formimonas warabiya]ATW27908.1 transporter [Candidatus Formimonas warabiya]
MDKNKKFIPKTIEEVTKDFGLLGRVDPAVFIISAVLIGIFVIWGAIDTKSLMTYANAGLAYITKRWGWLYMSGTLFFVFFCIFMAFSKFGKIKLGKPDDVPEYSTASWISMLFGCGIAVGLVYWSVGEPLYHYYAGPSYAGTAGSTHAAEWAMAISFLHWGISPWCIYLVCGLAMGLIIYRKNMPALVSSCFYPIFGDKIYGPLGKAIDISVLVATIFGTATSVGLGTLQFNAGLNWYFGVPNTATWNVICLAVVVFCYLCSACLPIERGIRIGSNASMIACMGLLLFVFILGPTTFILNNFVNALGLYVQNFITMSLFLDPVKQEGWVGGWTIFYWAWWIAWAPAVGMFIAKISKGRTIREFFIGAMFAPCLIDMVYFCVYGSTGLHFELMEKTKNLIWAAVQKDVPTGLYSLLGQFPGGSLVGIVNLFVIFTFFVVSADAITIVLGMLSSGGNPEPKTSLKIFWGILMGAVTGVLMLAGGLGPMQTASILAVFPVMFIMLGMCYVIGKFVKEEITFYEPTSKEYVQDKQEVVHPGTGQTV